MIKMLELDGAGGTSSPGALGARKHARLRKRLMQQLRAVASAAEHWAEAEQTGSRVLSSLANISSRMPLIKRAAAESDAAAVDAGGRDGEDAWRATERRSATSVLDELVIFDDIGNLLLQRHLAEVEKQLSNLRGVMSSMRAATADMDGAAAAAAHELGSSVSDFCKLVRIDRVLSRPYLCAGRFVAQGVLAGEASERSLQHPVSLSDVVEWATDARELYAEETARKGALVRSVREDLEGSAGAASEAWLLASLPDDAHDGPSPAHVAECLLKALHLDRDREDDAA